MSTTTSTVMNANQLVATLESAMASIGFAGWDTSMAGALTAFGVPVVCFAALYLQRGSQGAASMAFKIFYLCTGLGYAGVAVATLMMKGLKDDGKMPGLKLGDENATHLLFWLVASLIPMGAAAMLAAANVTAGNAEGNSTMVTMLGYLVGLGATAGAAITVFLDEAVLIDFLKLTLNEAMLRLAPAVLATVAWMLAVKGRFVSKMAGPGNDQVMNAAGAYLGMAFFFCFGVSDDCALPEGPLREAGNCPFPADFNEYAVLNSVVILASLFMMWAGAKDASAAQEANSAVVMDAPPSDEQSKTSASESD